MDIEHAYREYSASLYRYLLRFTADAGLAEDTVHDVFMRLHQRPPVGNHVRPWLFRVATNLALDRMRTTRNRMLLLNRSPAGTGMSDAPLQPDGVAERNDLARRVRAALQRVSERDRTVLLMQAEGFRHREIAAALDMSTGAVGAALARAQARLSTLLDASNALDPQDQQ